MKKGMCILFAALMVFGCCASVGARQDTFKLIDFQSADDFDGWQRRNFALAEHHKTSEIVRIGNYSLKMVDFETEYDWSFSVDQGIQNMSYLNMWLYCDNPNNVTIDFRPTIGGKEIKATWTIQLDWTGWKLFSFPLSSYSGEISKILFSTYGYGFGARGTPSNYADNTKENLTNTTLYLNYVWLSREYPAEKEYGSSTVADGATLVKHNLAQIDITAKEIYKNSLNSGNVSINPDTAFRLSLSEDKLIINFDRELDFATDYTVSIDGGFYDGNGMNFAKKTISFRTRGENENIPPNVMITAPEAGARFFPGDAIVLKAEASDENGTVKYVEFYCDGKLIENSRSISQTGEYIFEWKTAAENLSGNEITAVAYDNDGAQTSSEGVRIKIAGYYEPNVKIRQQGSGTIYHSISGIVQDAELKISAECSDIDGTVREVRFYLNDKLLYTETENTEMPVYTYTEEIAAGEYLLRVKAIDNDGLQTESAVALSVVDLGKQLPALTQKNTDKPYAERSCTKALDTGIWQIDAEVVIKPQTAHVLQLVGTNCYDLLNFTADGAVYANGTEIANISDGIHYVKIVVDSETSRLQCVLDNQLVIENMTCTASVFSDGASLRLTDAEKDQSYISRCGFYKLKEAAELECVTLYDEGGQTIADMSGVDLYADSILVEFAGGICTDSLQGNLILTETGSGQNVPLSFKGSKAYLKSKLRSDSTYRFTIGSDISDSDGAGLCGDAVFEFTTQKNPVTVRLESCADVLTSATDSVVVTATLKNNTRLQQQFEVICAVYDGNRQRLPYISKKVTLAAGEQREENISVNLNGVTADTVLEAFAVESAEAPVPVGDTVFRIAGQ